MSSFTSTVDLSPTDIYFTPLKDLTDAEDTLYDFPPSSTPKWFSHATPHNSQGKISIYNIGNTLLFNKIPMLFTNIGIMKQLPTLLI